MNQPRRSIGRATILTGIAGLVVGAVLGASSLELRGRISRLLPGAGDTAEAREQVTQSNLYALELTEIQLPPASRGGALAAVRDGVLIAGSTGELWFVAKSAAVSELALRVPINHQEFDSDPDLPSAYPLGLERVKDRFAVKGMLARGGPQGFELYASHHFWDPERNCVTLRLSRTELSYEHLAGSELPLPSWETVFETSPCLPLIEGDLYVWAEEAGGRIVELGDSLLLSVGDHGFASMDGGKSLAQSADNTYGKTMLIDETGEAGIYTLGHRNPQGLAAAPDGTVYLTEHGPSGGDEVNVLVEGANYGWPVVTYGRVCDDLACTETSPDDLSIVPNRQLSEHEGYEKPLFSWVPSIGISNLVSVTGPLFEHWRGDLLVSSLKAQSLFRLRIRDGRAVYVEHVVDFGVKIRDLVELADGTIVAKSDGARLFFVVPAELSRAQQLVAQCAACHAMTESGSQSIGPSLFGIVGRPIASSADYAYSDALRILDGAWTEERLAAFLRAPQEFAPGNTMQFPGIPNEADIDSIVEYVSSLQ